MLFCSHFLNGKQLFRAYYCELLLFMFFMFFMYHFNTLKCSIYPLCSVYLLQTPNIFNGCDHLPLGRFAGVFPIIHLRTSQLNYRNTLNWRANPVITSSSIKHTLIAIFLLFRAKELLASMCVCVVWTDKITAGEHDRDHAHTHTRTHAYLHRTHNMYADDRPTDGRTCAVVSILSEALVVDDGWAITTISVCVYECAPIPSACFLLLLLLLALGFMRKGSRSEPSLLENSKIHWKIDTGKDDV